MPDSVASPVMAARPVAQVLTVGELAHRKHVFVAECLQSKAKATRGTYNRCLNEFSRWVEGLGGSCPMTPEAMDRYQEYLTVERALGPRTVSTYLTALRQFVKYLVTTGFLNQNPTLHLKITSAPAPKATQALSAPEIRQLIAAVDTSTTMGKRDLAIIYAMIYAGLTETDIERADVADMERTLLGIHIRVQGKGSRVKAETAPLDPPVMEKIADYLKLRPAHGLEDPLFLSHSNRSRGGRLDTRSIRRRMTKYLEKAGLRRPGITTQSLTLTALLLWLQEGKSLREIRGRVRVRKLRAKIAHLQATGMPSSE